ncbi:MAG: outer membrane lipoprotein carrier protein LolA, partial [Acholeplasmatales bacterium]|nr:outer membrane lipoprotein carrier protein LolA [Acholeplasmatales bacterium]
MKKLYMLLMLCAFLFVGCDNKSSKKGNIDELNKYISNLDSYELSASMTINRSSKEIKSNINVSYLKPNFYKVCFINDSANEQIIIKNNEGVFVLNPSLNKEFRFDSDWPLNSSHAYILEAIMNDILKDENAVYTLENDVLTVEAKINHKTNSNLVKMKFYFDMNAKKPIKTTYLNSNNEEKLIVEFKTFEPNKSLKAEDFNKAKVLDEKTNTNEGSTNSESVNIVLNVGYIIEGTTLSSSSINDNESILCYTGDKSYTIVAEEAAVYNKDVVVEEFNGFDILECGLILISDNKAQFYYNTLEVSIYSNELDYNELVTVAN